MKFNGLENSLVNNSYLATKGNEPCLESCETWTGIQYFRIVSREHTSHINLVAIMY